MKQLSLATMGMLSVLFFMQNVKAQTGNTKYGAFTFYGDNTGSYNSAFGYYALFSNTAGSNNSAFGSAALSSNMAGYQNTALGSDVLRSNTSGYKNTGSGYAALQANTTGTYNTANGYSALNKNTTGTHNSAFGSNALNYNTTGSYNSANGTFALFRNTAGSNNTASGHNALAQNSTGYENTASGFQSLSSNTTGTKNTASGSYALNYNSTGTNNTASGYKVLYANSTGSYNVASGNNALQSNTTGGYNIALGGFALASNTGGNYNTATGYAALYYNTYGYYNTANGYFSLYNNTIGFQNTAIGYYALHLNSTGKNNTTMGVLSLFSNATGLNNTAMGSYALRNNTTGSRNTAVGDSAGAKYNYNLSTFVGYKTTTSVAGLSNVTVLGYGASATASNQVRVGNSNITSIGGKVGWTTLSDGRFKKNIQEDVPGLTFITKLRPVTYTLDIAALDKASGSAEEVTGEQGTAKALAAKEKHTGFVAQEVEKAATELKYDFGGVDKPKNDKDLYGLRYAEFVVPLVKAVQEQQTQIEQLHQQIAELKAMVTQLANGQAVTTTTLSSAYLEQNTPNPVSGTTTIQYHIPETTTAARLDITNAKGQLIKTVNLNNKGTGQVNVNTTMLASGTYNYTLYVDGKQVDSKRLVVVR